MSSMSSDARIVDGDQTPNELRILEHHVATVEPRGGLGLFECWLSRGSRLNVKPFGGRIASVDLFS